MCVRARFGCFLGVAGGSDGPVDLSKSFVASPGGGRTSASGGVAAAAAAHRLTKDAQSSAVLELAAELMATLVVDPRLFRRGATWRVVAQVWALDACDLC